MTTTNNKINIKLIISKSFCKLYHRSKALQFIKLLATAGQETSSCYSPLNRPTFSATSGCEISI